MLQLALKVIVSLTFTLSGSTLVLKQAKGDLPHEDTHVPIAAATTTKILNTYFFTLSICNYKVVVFLAFLHQQIFAV